MSMLFIAGLIVGAAASFFILAIIDAVLKDRE